jgi:hypothetical protein
MKKGGTHSEEAKRKISKNNAKTMLGRKGKDHPKYGKTGDDNPKSKPIILIRLISDERWVLACSRDACRMFNLDPSNLCSVLNGRLKQTKGFTAEFI